jgi:hypothetical protein
LEITELRECIRYSAAAAARLNSTARDYGLDWRARATATIARGGDEAGLLPGENWNHVVVVIDGVAWMFDTTAGQFHGGSCVTVARAPRGWRAGGKPWLVGEITYWAVPEPVPALKSIQSYREGLFEGRERRWDATGMQPTPVRHCS